MLRVMRKMKDNREKMVREETLIVKCQFIVNDD